MKNKIYSFFIRSLFSIILVLIVLCAIKKNPNFKNDINKYIFNTNISFSKINNFYEKYFGGKINFNNTDKVFNEKFTYKKLEEIENGVSIDIYDNYLMPNLESGIIAYIGKKDNLGFTIIIECINGIDYWYVGNIDTNYKLYDYVSKDNILGSVNGGNIKLYFEKNKDNLKYKKYFK